MDEKHEIIKAKVENAYNRIKDAEKVLEEMREECEHPETKLCTYSTRIGQYWDDTEVCSICGDVVRWKENPQMPIWKATQRVDEGFVHVGIDPWTEDNTEVQRIKWTNEPENFTEIMDMGGWIKSASPLVWESADSFSLDVETPKGHVLAKLGDYIIKMSDGTFKVEKK